jgi:asparagine synthase (glutamine-hydrolysing)
VFGGYASFTRLARFATLFRMWGRAPLQVRAFAAQTLRAAWPSTVRTEKAASMLESDGSLASLVLLARQVLSRQQRSLLLEPQWLEAAAARDDTCDTYEILLKEAYAGGVGTLAGISYAEARTYMHDVLLRDTDQMSMAHALEVRVPFLDHKLVEYVMGLPEPLKRPNGTPKRLLVESLNGLLPPEVVHRPKRGFVLPFAPWMRGPLRRFCEERLAPSRLGQQGIIRPQAAQRLWQQFLANRPGVSWSRLWILVVLEEWLERHRAAG